MQKQTPNGFVETVIPVDETGATITPRFEPSNYDSVTLSYDAGGSVITKTFFNNSTMVGLKTYTYDTSGNLASVTLELY